MFFLSLYQITGVPLDQVDERCTEAQLWAVEKNFDEYQKVQSSGVASLLATLFASKP